MIGINIEMPTYCYDCPCHNSENGQCNVTGEYTFDKRPFDCPLCEIKEVKHAHWVNGICTNCGIEKPIVTAYRAFSDIVYQYKGELNYCPNCGAQMEK